MKETLFSLRGEGPLKLNSVLWAVWYAEFLALTFAVMIFWAADYTWLRSTIWKDPSFLSQYEVFDQAFGYGVAIRKASPRRQIIERSFATAWSVLYPHAEMSDYRVRGLHMPLTLQAQSATLAGQR